MFNLMGGFRYAVVAAAVVLVGAISFGLGYRLARGDCAARELEVARAYAAHSDAVAEFARQQSENAAVRITAVRGARTKALSRVKELERALANLPRRAECDFPPDELRALDALREAYGSDRRSELPAALRRDADARQSAAGLRARPDGVGLRVQQPAR